MSSHQESAQQAFLAATFYSVDRRDFVPPPTNIQDLQGRYLEGVYRDTDHLIAVVDVDKILEETEK